MERISKKGRTYIKGRFVGSDLRRIVIDDIISAGRCPETAYFLGEFKYVADKFKLSNTTIKNIWVSFCERKTVDPHPHGGGNPSKLGREDLKLIEVLITANPTISHKELLDKLEEHGDVFGEASRSELSRVIHCRMISGKEYMRKKVTTVAIERFSHINMVYTQMFTNYLHSKDPFTLKFFAKLD